jgi:hypothetical protein
VRQTASIGAWASCWLSFQLIRSRLTSVTSAHDTWTTRRTPAWRAALRTFSLPATLIQASALLAARGEFSAAQ